MVSNTAAEALSQFLNSTPSQTSGGQLMDRLGKVLSTGGDEGLSFAEAMAMAALRREDFLSALSAATASGLVERFDAGGETRLRLTPAARSLY